MHAHLSRRLPLALFVLSALFSLAVSQAAEAALTRKSPEVLQAVQRGVEYLAAHGDSDSRPGACALAGLAMLTGGKEHDHPMVVKCAASIQKILAEDGTDKFDVYSTGLSLIFLVDLDPKKYRSEIERLLTHLIKMQKRHGGWGYPNLSTGDTSMTQYGVLGLWKARRAGFDVTQESIERATRWLLGTQDPSGGFGYQGRLGKNDQLVKQSEVRPSLTAAGLGSLYICCDMLDIAPEAEQHKRKEDLPPAIKEVKPKDKDKSGKPKTKTSIKVPAVREAQTLGNQWFAKNFKVDTGRYNNYFFYAFERYMTFHDKWENKKEENPAWYSEIAAYLLDKQADDGSWKADCGTVSDTAFASLFLLRYTDKLFSKEYGYGLMVSRSGLPNNFGDAVVTPEGKIVPKNSLPDIDGMLKDLLERKLPDFDEIGPPIERLPADDIGDLIEKYPEAFRRMISGRSVETRLAAVRAYGKTRNLDHFEVFLYAMTDPAPAVVHEANAALMRIRRSPGAVVLPDNFTEADRSKAIKKWKTWYLSVRPDAKFQWSGTLRTD